MFVHDKKLGMPKMDTPLPDIPSVDHKLKRQFLDSLSRTRNSFKNLPNLVKGHTPIEEESNSNSYYSSSDSEGIELQLNNIKREKSDLESQLEKNASIVVYDSEEDGIVAKNNVSENMELSDNGTSSYTLKGKNSNRLNDNTANCNNYGNTNSNKNDTQTNNDDDDDDDDANNMPTTAGSKPHSRGILRDMFSKIVRKNNDYTKKISPNLDKEIFKQNNNEQEIYSINVQDISDTASSNIDTFKPVNIDKSPISVTSSDDYLFASASKYFNSTPITPEDGGDNKSEQNCSYITEGEKSTDFQKHANISNESELIDDELPTCKNTSNFDNLRLDKDSRIFKYFGEILQSIQTNENNRKKINNESSNEATKEEFITLNNIQEFTILEITEFIFTKLQELENEKNILDQKNKLKIVENKRNEDKEIKIKEFNVRFNSLQKQVLEKKITSEELKIRNNLENKLKRLDEEILVHENKQNLQKEKLHSDLCKYNSHKDNELEKIKQIKNEITAQNEKNNLLNNELDQLKYKYGILEKDHAFVTKKLLELINLLSADISKESKEKEKLEGEESKLNDERRKYDVLKYENYNIQEQFKNEVEKLKNIRYMRDTTVDRFNLLNIFCYETNTFLSKLFKIYENFIPDTVSLSVDRLKTIHDFLAKIDIHKKLDQEDIKKGEELTIEFFNQYVNGIMLEEIFTKHSYYDRSNTFLNNEVNYLEMQNNNLLSSIKELEAEKCQIKKKINGLYRKVSTQGSGN
ncbi:hypothetical protein TBLA_0E03490 [Henningerozyma blattae CBS 6284]|uniref:Uncharacterized protein n=1 Tax=Henningerozyma blattae (strain ATCC 34711 / CBS 6284 / DSM 70876 / NBRC 10599 / NRRL Y-10934 / UCD 77-7) TaxID=1071380 RepID=I2H4V2_HENB6|nr:hypothetical protein TBLA_0E03490 [Tetrapisispora blattae CBS 6284]CCH61404.1 hypothetical protein TBLA_0E03490 [Tetrapisispora blattae CBS 6284]